MRLRAVPQQLNSRLDVLSSQISVVPKGIQLTTKSIRKSIRTTVTVSSVLGPYWTLSAISASPFGGAVSVKIDVAGNIYVLSNAIRITKYSSAGTFLWCTELDAYPYYINAGSSDSFAIDSLQNVYVCSSSIVAKITPNGELGAFYSFPSSDCYSIAVDNDGSIYVGGSAYVGPPALYKAFVAKLDSTGVQKWITGTTNLYDLNASVKSIIYTPSGHIYIGINDLIHFAKLDATTGTVVWKRMIAQGLDNEFSFSSMAVGPSGEIYMLTTRLYDIFLAKYNSDGYLEWQYTCGSTGIFTPGAINTVTVTPTGKIYVSVGHVPVWYSSDTTYTIAEYNAAGVRQWIRKCAGLNTTLVYVSSIVVDSDGDLLIGVNAVGYSEIVVLKLPSDGSLSGAYAANTKYIDCSSTTAYTDVVPTLKGISTPSYIDFSSVIPEEASPLSLTYSNITSVYTSKNIIAGIDTTKYWLTVLDNLVYSPYEIFSDNGSAHVIDSDGNIYVAGSTKIVSGASTKKIAVIAKYSSRGILLWQRTFTGAGLFTFDKELVGICLDSSGNVYLSALFYVVKYNSEGTLQWQTNWSSLYGYKSAIDNNGNIFVVGTRTSEALLVKFNSSGVIQWAQKLGETYYYQQTFDKIAIDSSGYVYVTGFNIEGSFFVLAKYDGSTGNLLWHRYLNDVNGIGNIVLAPTGDIYVGGNSLNAKPHFTKYSADGVIQWSRSWGDDADLSTVAFVAVDSSNNIYAFSGYDILVKYDANGDLQWQRRLVGITFSAADIKISSAGDIHIIGHLASGGDAEGIFVLKLPSDGSLTGTYDFAGVPFDYVNASIAHETITLSDQVGYSIHSAVSPLTGTVAAGTSAVSTLTSTLVRIGG